MTNTTKVYKTIIGDESGRRIYYTLHHVCDPSNTTTIKRDTMKQVAGAIFSNDYDNIKNQVPENCTLISIPREGDGSRIKIERNEPLSQDEVSRLQSELQNKLERFQNE